MCTLSEGVEAFGSVLHSPQFLGLAAVYELGKVGTSDDGGEGSVEEL